MANIESTQKRIFLWTCPRSLSTAFYRAISNAPGTLGIFEPYSTNFGYGATRKTDCTPAFKDITAKLNETHKGRFLRFPYKQHVIPENYDAVQGYDTIFVKDVAYCVMAAPHPIEDILPEGYIHTFLIRDPRKSVPSLYKLSTTPGPCGWTDFNWKHGGHKTLYELYTYLTQDLGVTCFVLDADDLQDNPEATLKEYCAFVGIPFHQSMVHWNMADSSRFDVFKEATGSLYDIWYKNATSTSTFNRPNKRSTLDVTSHPPIVQETINKLMPYYQLMYNKRLTVENHIDPK